MRPGKTGTIADSTIPPFLRPRLLPRARIAYRNLAENVAARTNNAGLKLTYCNITHREPPFKVDDQQVVRSLFADYELVTAESNATERADKSSQSGMGMSNQGVSAVGGDSGGGEVGGEEVAPVLVVAGSR